MEDTEVFDNGKRKWLSLGLELLFAMNGWF